MAEIDRKHVSILRVLERAERPLGAGKIAKELLSHGLELTERAVRYHLEALDEDGLTEPMGRPGRRITDAGRRELSEARVADKVSLVHTKLEAFAYQTTLDLASGRGTVALNISFVPRDALKRALAVMRPVLNSRFATSRRIRLYEGGEWIGSQVVPREMAGIGTVCSVTVNGVLLREGVPVQSLFGGLIAVEGGTPRRFTEIVHYGYTSLDPIEVFIKSGATSAGKAVSSGHGVIGASFRQFPTVARDHVLRVMERIMPWGLGGVIAVGSPSCPLFEVEVGPDLCGMAISAGLNPIAAVEEAGITTVSHAMTTLADFDQFTDINELSH
jgi:HTH-type transcriptional regulator, global nitrogen regulator NrpRI